MLGGSRIRVGIVLGLTFAAGLAGGVALDRRVLDRPHATSGRRSDRERGPVIERFASELDLSQDQRTRIETILDHYRARMKAIWQDVHPRYSAIVDSARSEIEDVLTPQQVQQYRSLLRQEYRHRDDGGAREGSIPSTHPETGGDSATGRDSSP